MNTDNSILVISDELENGELVRGLLDSHFPNVQLTCDPACHMSDLVMIQPVVLVLAFTALDASRQFLLAARNDDSTLARRPHSNIVLCSTHDAQKAFELCKQGFFDDYVMFWPVTHDGSRLPMTVLQAMRNARRRSFPADVVEESGSPALDDIRPAARDPELAWSTPDPASAESTSRRHEPQTVLFVDDDRHQHLILRLILEGTDLVPVFADTANAAIELLATLQPGLILVDINLPDGSGVDLIRTIKSDALFADTPIITVTGHRTREVVFGAIGAGAVDFIAKPYARETLLGKIRRALKPIPAAMRSMPA